MLLSDGHGGKKKHVNPTANNLCHTKASLPEYQALIMKSFVWELPGLPPRLVFISHTVPQKTAASLLLMQNIISIEAHFTYLRIVWPYLEKTTSVFMAFTS